MSRWATPIKSEDQARRTQRTIGNALHALGFFVVDPPQE
jgi:hypothetical protein